MKNVTVITATIGRRELLDCVRSVALQTYTHIDHWVVVDGPDRSAAVCDLLDESEFEPTVLHLPQNTGHSKYLGHRIYGAVPFLTDSPWIIYLDEDNWLEPDHVESLMKLVEESQLDWAYSLRNVTSSSGQFICRDNCQSLGWWGAYDGGYYLIDTSCYLIKRDLAVKYAPMWNRPAYNPVLETPDRALCRALLTDHPLGYTTGLYTVNYRLGGNRSEAKDRAFFANGNESMDRYHKAYPWVEKRLGARSQTHPTMHWLEHAAVSRAL